MRLRWAAFALAPVVAAALLFAGAASAHTRSVSYSSWQLQADGAAVSVRVPLVELARLGFHPVHDIASGGPAARYLAERLALFAGDARCAPTAAPRAAPDDEGWARFRFRVRCAAGGPLVLQSSVLLEARPSHLHFTRVARAGEPIRERVLSGADARWALDAPEEARRSGTTLAGYVALGFTHILGGWDHLAFLAALLLLAVGFRELAWLVTSFTIAHSLTLGLAVLGWVRPDAAAVEALIGYSIALVAAENAWLLAGRGRALPAAVLAGTATLAAFALFGVGAVGAAVWAGLALFAGCHFALLARVDRPARLRAAVAFGFGLVHGFGFAGVLAELALPTARLAPALFGFNVGVELGQLAVIALAWPLLASLARKSPELWHPRVAAAGSAAVCGLGLFWFASRTFA